MQYPELAVGRRRHRQDVAANEVAQMVSTVGLESSLWASDTWAYPNLVYWYTPELDQWI
jgi:hypothetical protein